MSAVSSSGVGGSVSLVGSPTSRGSKYSLVHLSDQLLQRGLVASAVRDRAATAQLLAYLAEFEERQLYLPAGYESLHAYCLGELRLSEDAALKRAQAARIAREFPGIFTALEEGRLHLSAVVLLAPRLRELREAGAEDRCAAMLAAAEHQTSAAIRDLLAAWFPRVARLGQTLPLGSSEPASDTSEKPRSVGEPGSAFVPTDGPQPAPEQVDAVDTWLRVTALSGDRFELRGTIDRATLELLRQNQSLLSHCVPSGNVAEVLRRALAESARQLEKRKFRSSGTARDAARHSKPGDRYVPKHVRDAVWQRDGGQCTFVGETGHRCGSRTRLELDHIVPVALGGQSTVDNLRVRCRAHNQYEAERAFGADFMRGKREQAGQLRAEEEAATGTKCGPGSAATAKTVASPSSRDWIAQARARASAAGLVARHEPDVISALKQLGIRAERAKELAHVCDTIPEAPFEERLRVALSIHGAAIAKPVRASDGRGALD